MAKKMTRLSSAEASELLRSRGVRRAGAHQMTKKILHWPYCARCGLVRLNNDVTRRALRKECVTWE